MKKPLLLASLFALCALLVAGSFISSGYAKGAKKEAAQVEKTAKKATTKPKATKPATTKPKTATTAKDETTSASEQLFKANGTSQAEIKALIQQASGPNATSTTPMAGEQINWQVISGGGGSGSSTNFGLVSVIGQTAVGTGSSTNFNLSHGFLQSFASAGCCVTAGDFNNDGTFNITDVTSGIARIFTGGGPPSCQDQADFNGDGTFNISDVTGGIARIFTGGGPPVCGTTGT